MTRRLSAAQRTARVDVLAEADVLDVEVVQLVEHLEEVPHRARDSIRGPDQDGVEAAAAGVGHDGIQTGFPHALTVAIARPRIKGEDSILFPA